MGVAGKRTGEEAVKMVREVEDEDAVEPPGEALMLEEEENRPRSRRGTW